MGLYTVIAFAASIFVPLIAGVRLYNHLPSKVKIFLLLIIVGTLNEILMSTLALMHINNSFTLHFYTLFELLILGAYFYRSIKSMDWKLYVLFGSLATMSLGLLYAFYGENIYGFNSLPRAVESLFIISLAIWLLSEKYITRHKIDITTDGTLWITGGILFYFSTSVFVFAFSKYFMNSDYLITLLSAHVYVNAFCNIIYALGIWLSSRSHGKVVVHS